MSTLKRCPKCKRELALTEFFKCNQSKSGLTCWCKSCVNRDTNERTKRYRAKMKSNPVQPPQEKGCSGCSRILDASMFSPDFGTKTGLDYYCKDCRKEMRVDLKVEVFRAYCEGDPFCRCCGEREMAFLTIDHVNGGGHQHRKQLKGLGTLLYRFLKKQGYPEGYQVLCMNCNWGKQIMGECPHERQRREAVT